jgi:UDP-4-amino-4-deoxy-L-arabinose formyltransferase/UDP-glucuronic acid dehydrogenase (UDP-4-keto-hexauronic acid decarboxylating)
VEDPRVRAVVLGYHTLGCLGFDALLRHGFDVAAVVTHRDDPRETIWWESLGERAAARGIPLHHAASGKERGLLDLVARCEPDFIFSFYFRFMIAGEILARAGRGALNLHGSLLPRYRGRAPVNWVLVNGESETGVSLHRMVALPDAGELVDQERVAIEIEDTAFTLYGKLATAAVRLLDRALPALKAGTEKAIPLDLARGSYFGARTPEDGRIDWSWPAARIYDLVRAVTHPYPGAFTTHRGRSLRIWWAIEDAQGDAQAVPGTVLRTGLDGIVVAAGRGAVRIVTVQRDGQPELPASAFAVADGIVSGDRFLTTGGGT